MLLLFQPQQPLWSYTLEAIGPLSSTKDGTYLAGGSFSGNAYIWDVSYGTWFICLKKMGLCSIKSINNLCIHILSLINWFWKLSILTLLSANALNNFSLHVIFRPIVVSFFFFWSACRFEFWCMCLWWYVGV